MEKACWTICKVQSGQSGSWAQQWGGNTKQQLTKMKKAEASMNDWSKWKELSDGFKFTKQNVTAVSSWNLYNVVWQGVTWCDTPQVLAFFSVTDISYAVKNFLEQKKINLGDFCQIVWSLKLDNCIEVIGQPFAKLDDTASLKHEMVSFLNDYGHWNIV